MSSSTMHDSKDKDSASYQKRRDQVRRAQRTHRERKENYIKYLEEEVHQLRTNERKILQENEDLRCRISQHDGLSWLQDHIDTDVDFSHIRPDSDNFNVPTLGLTWDLPLVTDSECSRSTTDFESCRLRIPHVSSSPSPIDLNMVSRRTSINSLAEDSRTDLAIEFVLTLEKPCFNRVSSAVFDIGHTTNHTLSVLNAIDYHTVLETDFLHSKKSTQGDANIGLTNLLALSSSFGLTSDVTPVQAWHQISSHPEFSMMDVSTLRFLVEDMLEHIQCYGFGAVIETSVFKLLFSKILAKR